MAGAGGTCLSDLSDDLVRRILFFAPAREGAATAVLSRRWRWLWRTSGAVNLDSRSGSSTETSDGFLRAAVKALAAARGPVRRLTFFIAERSRISLPEDDDDEWLEQHSLIDFDGVVSNPAARRVEELRIEVHGQCALSFGSLPSEALRVLLLRTVDCSLTAMAAAHHHRRRSAAVHRLSFPCLAELHLKGGRVPLVDLQNTIDAAPLLSTLHLEFCHFSTESTFIFQEERSYRLLCPSVTALVLAKCRFKHDYLNKNRLEINAPRLQFFTYKGPVRLCYLLSLKSQSAASNMIQVDLHLSEDRQPACGRDQVPPRESFWQFVQKFKTTKILKLRLEDFTMDHLALGDKASQDELQVQGGFSFCLLEQLELEAKFTASMAMLANLLHRCPMLRDLRLKISKQHQSRWIESSIDNEAGVDFDKSVSGFRKRRRIMVSSGTGGKNDDKYEAFCGIRGFENSEHRPFRCLQSHLQRVSLDLFMDEPNCGLGVQLTKFFAENAVVLQEMHINIDDGAKEMLEHVNPSVRWMANTRTAKNNNQLNAKD